MGFFKSLGRLFTGTKPSVRKESRFTGPQEAALSQLLSRGMADTDMGGLEKRYRHLFERDTVPDLAERFTAMGGGQRSSAFEESLRRGGMDMGEQLAGLRQQGGMQALGLGLQPQFENMMMPGTSGLMGPLISRAAVGGLGGLSGLGGALGGALGGLFGGRGQQRHQQAPASSGGYIPGQPKGMQRLGSNPVLRKIIQGLQL